MKGYYLPFCDEVGMVGYNYICPECDNENILTNCDEGCENCNFSETYTDADQWYEEEMKKPKKERAWNQF